MTGAVSFRRLLGAATQGTRPLALRSHGSIPHRSPPESAVRCPPACGLIARNGRSLRASPGPQEEFPRQPDPPTRQDAETRADRPRPPRFAPLPLPWDPFGRREGYREHLDFCRTWVVLERGASA